LGGKASQPAVPGHNRGIAYANKGELDKAIADFTELIRLDPTGEAYYDRGKAYQRRGDTGKAELDLNEARRLGFGTS
jgi:Flp pilus assembly protein TadD